MVISLPVSISSCFEYTVIVLNFHSLLFLFSNKMLVIKAGIYKMRDIIGNRKGLYCLPRFF